MMYRVDLQMQSDIKSALCVSKMFQGRLRRRAFHITDIVEGVVVVAPWFESCPLVRVVRFCLCQQLQGARAV